MINATHSSIRIERGALFGSWIPLIAHTASRFAIITDENVKNLYAHRLYERLLQQGCSAALFTFPPGEKSKSRVMKEILEDQMSEEGFGRECAVIAIGGGIVTDLAGFIAATYCRGVPLISIPTTLLGMVDASIGGKVGVNTPQAKNWIGTTYLPEHLLIDPEMLMTLSQEELLNGLSEVIKYALIASKDLFQTLQNPDHLHLDQLIRESVAIKSEIVERDLHEEGLRRLLNFGHTIGHALEVASDYTLPHGQAIALGMVVESALSMSIGALPTVEFEAIFRLFENYGFALTLPPELNRSVFMESLKKDKKALAATPRFVLLKQIGQALDFDGAYCNTVSKAILDEIIEWMFTTFGQGS